MGNISSTQISQERPNDAPINGCHWLVGLLEEGEEPSLESLAPLYGARLEELFEGHRLPLQFASDIMAFRELCLLTREADFEGEWLDEEGRNLLVATLWRILQPDKLFNLLFSLCYEGLSQADLLSTLPSRLSLADHLYRVLTVLVCVLDERTCILPQMRSLCSRALTAKEIFSVLVANQADLLMVLSHQQHQQSIKMQRPAGIGEDLLARSIFFLCMALADAGKWQVVAQIAETSLQFLSSTPTTLLSLSHLACLSFVLGRSLTALGEQRGVSLLLTLFKAPPNVLEMITGKNMSADHHHFHIALDYLLQLEEMKRNRQALILLLEAILVLLKASSEGGIQVINLKSTEPARMDSIHLEEGRDTLQAMCLDDGMQEERCDSLYALVVYALFRAYLHTLQYSRAYDLASSLNDGCDDGGGGGGSLLGGRCLCELARSMCQAGKVKELCALPWLDKNILSVQVYLVDLAHSSAANTASPYYKALYVWHVVRSDHRAAAKVMYQFARRILQQVATPERISEATLYLALSHNHLALLGEEERWFVLAERDQDNGEGQYSTNDDRSAISKHNPCIIDETLLRQEVLYFRSLLELQSDYLPNVRLASEELLRELLSRSKVVEALDLAHLYNLDLQPLFNFILDSWMDYLINSEEAQLVWLFQLFRDQEGQVASKRHYHPERLALDQHPLEAIENLLRSLLLKGRNPHHYKQILVRFHSYSSRPLQCLPGWFYQDFEKLDANVLARTLLSLSPIEGISLRRNLLQRDCLTQGTIARLQEMEMVVALHGDRQ